MARVEKKLYLLRHGDVGGGGRLIGSTDLPLAAEGLGQLDRTAAMLQRKGIGSIFTSPLGRCLQTVERLGLDDSEVCVHQALREVHFGAWEGLCFSEIAREYPEEVRTWSTWSTAFTFPGGENMGDFLARVGEAAELIDRHPADNLLVVSHGGVIRQLICHYLGLEARNYLLFDIAAGCCSTLDLYSQGGVLTGLNLG